MYLDQLSCHKTLWTGPLRMLGRSSTHHPPEPPRLSEYLCRKSLEPRVSNLSLLQETMIRESHCITIQQFCSHLPYHTAMIKHNSYSKRYHASVIGVRSPRSLPARIAWYLMKFPLFIGYQGVGHWIEWSHNTKNSIYYITCVLRRAKTWLLTLTPPLTGVKGGIKDLIDLPCI